MKDLHRKGPATSRRAGPGGLATPTGEEVSAALATHLERLAAPPVRPAQLQHVYFDNDPAALRDLASIFEYLRKWRPLCPDDADLRALAKAARLTCKAQSQADAHQWLRAAVRWAKDFQYRAAAEHALKFAKNEAKPARKQDQLQAGILRCLRKDRLLTAEQVWALLVKRPPQGVKFIPHGRPPRFEWGIAAQEQCTLGPFRNRITRARKALQGTPDS